MLCAFACSTESEDPTLSATEQTQAAMQKESSSARAKTWCPGLHDWLTVRTFIGDRYSFPLTAGYKTRINAATYNGTYKYASVMTYKLYATGSININYTIDGGPVQFIYHGTNATFTRSVAECANYSMPTGEVNFRIVMWPAGGSSCPGTFDYKLENTAISGTGNTINPTNHVFYGTYGVSTCPII